MSELSKVKDLVHSILKDDSVDHLTLEEMYKIIEDKICDGNVCGDLECRFCPLETFKSFKQYIGEDDE